MNNAIGYPHEERPVGRPTYRVSGIHNDLLNAGAFMGFHAGWEQPDWYAQPGEIAEYKPSFDRYARFVIGLCFIKKNTPGVFYVFLYFI